VAVLKSQENKMRNIILCLDNGNRSMSDVKNYLRDHNCEVYTLPEKDVDTRAFLEEIRQKEGYIDLLLLGAAENLEEDGAIDTVHDWDRLLESVGGQINLIQNVIEEALPLLRKGNLKRIGMITRKESSISCCREDSDYGPHMAWAGLNMVGKIYFNLLRPEGFTFRWYCAEENVGGMSAGEYLLSRLCYDANEPYSHSDENRLVMRDSYLREIPW